MKQKLWVYISGPITIGAMSHNTRNALDAAEIVLAAGHHPIVPHLSVLWDIVHPKAWKAWIDYDMETIKRCDLVLRIPGESKGADLECAEAIRLAIPVIVSPADQVDWSKL